MADRSEDLLQRILSALEGRGSIGGRRTGLDGGNAGDALNETLENAEKSLRSYYSTQKEYNKKQQVGNFAAGLFGKTTEAANRDMGRLQNAIRQQEQALDDLISLGHDADSQKRKEIEGGLKMLKTQEAMYNAQATGASIISNSAQSIFQTFLRLGVIQAEYQVNLLNIVSQGGSGFQMAAAALENAVNQMHAVQSTLSQIAISAGQSLGQLGGKFAPLAGMALGALGHAAQAAADAQKMLAMAQIRIMAQEGDKLIKTHYQLTQTGVIFGNGMQGLIDATKGTKLRLEEMSAVVSENRDTFSRLGIGMSQATKLIGGVAKILASTTGQFARADRQLLALGYSYQEQAELAAETAAMMSRGGQRVGEKQVAEATMEMAKNMRLVAEVAGEDMKEKRKTIRAEQEKFAINAALAKMSRDEPQKYKQYMAQLDGMSDAQRKASYEMLVYNTVRDKDVALQIALNKGFKKTFEENQAALKNGTAGTKQAVAAEQKNSRETTDGYIAMGATVGKANMALGSLESLAQAASKELDRSTKLINVSVEEALKNIVKVTEKAKEAAGKDPTTILLEAVEKGAIAAKLLQEKVIDKLPALSAAMTKAFQDAMDALDGKGAGAGGPLAGLAKWLPEIIAAVTALTLVMQFVPDKLKDKLFNAIKSLPKGFPGSNKGGVDTSYVDMAEGKTPQGKTPGKGGRFANMAGKGLGMVKALGPGLITSAVGMGTEALGEYLKEQGHEGAGKAAMVAGKAAEFAGIGMMIGSIIPGVGTAIGGAIGGAVGAGIGVWQQFGDDIGSWTAETGKQLGLMWDSTAKAAKDLWKSAGAYTSAKWQEASNWVKSSTKEFLAEHPKLAAAVAKFPKSFDEAGKLAKGLLLDTQAKFKAEFPKLYDSLSQTFSTVGKLTDGLMTSIGEKWKDAKSWLASKLGYGEETQPQTTRTPSAAAAVTEAARPAGTPPTADLKKDPKLIRDYAYSIYKGKQDINAVPKHLQQDVLNVLKNPPKEFGQAYASPSTDRQSTAPPVPQATKGTPTSPPPPKPATPSTAGVPTKQALTAAEKSNVMETVAVNTKYANDLLINNQKNLESLVKAAINRLDSIVSATEATAGYGRKTANNTK